MSLQQDFESITQHLPPIIYTNARKHFRIRSNATACNKHTLQVASTSALNHSKSMQTLANASALNHSESMRALKIKQNKQSAQHSFPHLYKATHHSFSSSSSGRTSANLTTGSQTGTTLHLVCSTSEHRSSHGTSLQSHGGLHEAGLKAEVWLQSHGGLDESGLKRRSEVIRAQNCQSLGACLISA